VRNRLSGTYFVPKKKRMLTEGGSPTFASRRDGLALPLMSGRVEDNPPYHDMAEIRFGLVEGVAGAAKHIAHFMADQFFDGVTGRA
jgi:hypothetical protein